MIIGRQFFYGRPNWGEIISFMMRPKIIFCEKYNLVVHTIRVGTIQAPSIPIPIPLNVVSFHSKSDSIMVYQNLLRSGVNSDSNSRIRIAPSLLTIILHSMIRKSIPKEKKIKNKFNML